MALLTALQGLFGLITSKNVTEGSRYIFTLLLSYGVKSALHTAILWNGFEKSYGGVLKLMQAVVVIRLMTTLKIEQFDTTLFLRIIQDIMMSIFGTYPIVAQYWSLVPAQ